MIQRRQSLYLLTIVILGVILYFSSVIKFTTPESARMQRMFTLSAQGFEEEDLGLAYKNVEPLHIAGTWGMTVISLAIPLLALVDIFLFKKRVLQARLNLVTMVLCIGYYGMLVAYAWFIRQKMELDWSIGFGACIPLVCLVLLLGATRCILRDEIMVKSAERIR